jgi:hypothetical protein
MDQYHILFLSLKAPMQLGKVLLLFPVDNWVPVRDDNKNAEPKDTCFSKSDDFHNS